MSAYLASHTILETLLYMNSDENAAAGVGAYFRMAELGEVWDWAGADLVSDWFRRNMRIYTNIVQLVDSPDERVLVIYGSGHLGWLQYAFDNNPNFRLRKLGELVGVSRHLVTDVQDDDVTRLDIVCLELGERYGVGSREF